MARNSARNSMRDRDLHNSLAAYKASKVRSDWLCALSTACGNDIGENAFLDVSKTRALKIEFFAMVKGRRDAVHLCWVREGIDGMRRDLDRLRGFSGDSPVILFNSNDSYYGAVWVRLAWIVRDPLSVWEVTGEDLSFTVEDLSSGFCLERNYYDLEGKYVAEGVYELTAWGSFAPEALPGT